MSEAGDGLPSSSAWSSAEVSRNPCVWPLYEQCQPGTDEPSVTGLTLYGKGQTQDAGCPYIRSGASNPSISIQISRTFFVSTSSAIRLFRFSSFSSPRIFVS